MHQIPTYQRVISFFTACSLVGVYVFSALVMPRPAYAEAPSSSAAAAVLVSTAACRGASTAVTPDPCEGANEAAKAVDGGIISVSMQVALLSALLNLATFVFDRLAYEAAIWVATGGEGETPLFHAKGAREAWADFGLDIAGSAVDELNSTLLDDLNLEFDICAPENSLFKLSIQLGLTQAYKYQKPKCDFQDMLKNWDAFVTSTILQVANPSQTILKAFAEGFKPGQNELSATVGLNLKVHQRVLEAKTNSLFEQVNSGGFQSVKDIVTGQIKTPASILQSEFTRQIGDSQSEPTKLQMQAAIQNSDLLGSMFLHVASVFTNTLLSTLMNKIFTGLFDVQPTVDPFDQELAGISTREDAANRFSSLITVAPTQLENYNALAEFVACPVGPITVRNLNNCVMDTNFVTAVARAESGVPMTVQEAIDDGFLNGDWPLIPHEGAGIPKNQDPLCYTYGYCYGNIVKMRKARILPVGWEIAASRNDPSNAATLQEIVDGFDECGTQGGGADGTHRWCHLIDPDWVLKYPETQCRAFVNGELRISSLSPGRAGACVDTPSCISESNDGSCDGGYGYCVQEKNVWRFRGDECPEQYASCLSFQNTFTSESADFLFNTVDQSVCDANNAGCEWYRTNKYYDDAGTPDDTSDDSFEWLAGDDDFVTADREDDVRRYDVGTSAHLAASTYAYDTDGDGTDDESYGTYAYQDRIYFNNNVEECSEDAAGCSAVYPIGDSLVLNAIQNPSFEDDADEDGTPDLWTEYLSTPTLDTSGSYSYYGSNAFTKDSTAAYGMLFQSNVQIAPGNFYAFSYYARKASSSSTGHTTGRVVLKDADGNYLDLAGTSVAGDCAVADWSAGTNNSVFIDLATPSSTTYERFECIFTVPDEGNGALANVYIYATDNYIDAVQLELGEDASSFTDGYNSSSPATSYLLVPPDYLGCTGAATDPAECDAYTQVCSAQDVGCNLYTPENGDPSVPAIASTLDECPSECVGYATYKQDATDREDVDFPLYFIEDRATACSSQYVGCDAFTNVDATSVGGEGSESYTYLRACVKPEMATGSADDNESATYFTWEGSDASGYQLVTWTLLKSDDTDAPCTAWDVQGESVLVCAEDASVDYETDDCNDHADIFDNPDCREFYDTNGDIHYRDVTLTVAVDSDCHPYRFDGSSETDCEASGGYWTDVGDCRYFGLADESTECPATQAGCRAYTGGAGRNATTVFSDDFEDGDLVEYTEADDATMSVSNESVASDGHSMRMVVPSAITASGGSIKTLWAYLVPSSTSTTYDESDAASCPSGSISDSGECEIDKDSDGTYDCSVEDGDNGCGTLDDLLVPGKTYMLSFWAKGSTDLYVFMHDLGGDSSATSTDVHDFVDPTTTGFQAISLDSGWHSYELGPLDTTDFANFDDSSTLRFYADKGTADETVYIDNIRLKAVEENIAIIKDSWVVPSTCDQTPDGVDSPQYYLGCEAYTDQNGDGANLYQFSDLCSEEVVGCEAAYDTQNSDSAYGAVYNARCLYVTTDTTDDDTVSSNTSCEIEGETVCTITAGTGYCLFDRDGALPSTLPYTEISGIGYYYMALGPEAVVVDADVPMYLVDNGTTSCTAENVGCEEIGLPTYDQDKSNVTSFESAYYLNDPDSYDDTLCANEELFCEEWSSTQDGNFYFKDPVDQTCEYQTGVTIDGSSYYGWFKTDTKEPCYDDYVISGEQFGIWRNGDDAYDGWVAACSSGYDLCTEFRDLSDTSGVTYPGGTPYYFMDDDSLSEEALTASDQCQGQVSQREGCGLFYDTNDSELTYNVTASYVASIHADVLYGDAPGSKQDPISCDDGGEDITTPDGETLNLCERRCKYEIDSTDSISTPSSEEDTTTLIVCSNYSSCEHVFDASCYDDTDCPDIQTDGGDTVSGTCENAVSTIVRGTSRVEVTHALSDDSNRVVKVYRDRECSAWLSCQSSQVSWNARTSKYETICDKVGLCTRYSRTGDASFCTEWATTDAVVLSLNEYTGRDATWNGTDYSGYSIPDQLPVEHYDQINVSPDSNDFICVSVSFDSGSLAIPTLEDDGNFIECDDSDDTGGDCTEWWSVCRQVKNDYRLGYVAGGCDLGETGWLGECIVGYCETSGDSCSSDGDCPGSEECVVGYCQDVGTTVCYSNDDDNADGVADACDASFPVCDTILGMCVDQLAPNSDTCVTASDCSGSGTPTCTSDVLSKRGACVNGMCATDVYGDPIVPDEAESEECRGYPETTSPFPTEVVTEWSDTTGMTSEPSSSPEDFDWQPYSYVYGYETTETCSPTVNDVGDLLLSDDCVCSYDKATYGESGSITRYYPPNTALSSISTGTRTANQGVCLGGEKAGRFCSLDSDCQSGTGTDYSGGSCIKLNRKDTVYGWEGYCLERDTSIHKNGSSSEDDRACLTWLPVDQLAGSTDLYGKYMGAGYNQGDTYYCAEVDVGYVIKAGAEFYATLIDASDCEHGDNVDPRNTCPDGTFMAFKSCEERSISTYDYEDYEWKEDDIYTWKAMCIPKNSYVDGDLTKKCGYNTDEDTNYIDDSDPDHEWETWSQMANCQTPLLTAPSQVEGWIDVADNISMMNDYIDAKSDLLPDAVLVEAVPYCRSVVKVADAAVYNYAWTDRVFDKTDTQYEVKPIGHSGDGYFAFTAETEQTVFGKADDVTLESSFDTEPADESSPLTVLLCELSDYSFILPTAEESCSSGDLVGEHARSYMDVNVIEAGYPYLSDGTVDICDEHETSLQDNGCNSEEIACTDNVCVGGGIRNGQRCNDYEDCALLHCVTKTIVTEESSDYSFNFDYCVAGVPYVYAHETVDAVVDRISQFFAKSISLTAGLKPWWEYSFGNDWTNAKDSDEILDWGAYEQMTSSVDTWDYTATGDPYSLERPTAPRVISIGDCDGTDCEEGTLDKISVNGYDSGDIEGSGGYKHVAVSFFAYADEDQMPIRNIIVDWGNGKHTSASGEPEWPSSSSSQSGSTSDDNYYQNHRGYISTGVEQCDSVSSDANDWSTAPDACDTSYLTFINDYTCTATLAESLPACEETTDPSGMSRLTNSPCRGTGTIGTSGACVFQPRVHVKDNWGWCTGWCDSTDGVTMPDGNATEDATDGQCYDYECDTSDCPSEGNDSSCTDTSQGGITNPWINFDGYVIVTP